MLKNDLDAVSNDLDRLSRGQDVELHATFDKFGKTANLQVHDAPTDDGDGEKPDKNTGLKLFKPPTVRQVQRLQIFFDLSIFIAGFSIEVLRWKRLDLWNYLLICSMSGSLRSMHRQSQEHLIASSYIYLH